MKVNKEMNCNLKTNLIELSFQNLFQQEWCSMNELEETLAKNMNSSLTGSSGIWMNSTEEEFATKWTNYTENTTTSSSEKFKCKSNPIK